MSMICESCGHMPAGCVCGLNFAEKLRTIQLSPSAVPTRTKRRYWDEESLADTFGADAKDRYMEETKGLGAAYRDGKGGFMRRGKDGFQRVTDHELHSVYLNAPEDADVV
jgi:hypothetical protein